MIERRMTRIALTTERLNGMNCPAKSRHFHQESIREGGGEGGGRGGGGGVGVAVSNGQQNPYYDRFIRVWT